MLRDHELSLFQRVILCILAVMAVLFAVLTAVSRSNEGVLFEEMLMDISTDGNKTIYTGKKYGEDVTVVCYRENGANIVDFSVSDRYHALCRVEYPAGTITTEYGLVIPRIQLYRNDALLFSGGYNPDLEDSVGRYYNEDGTFELFISAKMTVGYSSDPWYNYEFTETDILFFANGPGTSVRGSWLGYAACLFLSVLCAVETALPNTLFYLNHRLAVKNPEPTEFYYAMQRLSSVVLTGTALILHILALRQIE